MVYPRDEYLGAVLSFMMSLFFATIFIVYTATTIYYIKSPEALKHMQIRFYSSPFLKFMQKQEEKNLQDKQSQKITFQQALEQEEAKEDLKQKIEEISKINKQKREEAIREENKKKRTRTIRGAVIQAKAIPQKIMRTIQIIDSVPGTTKNNVLFTDLESAKMYDLWVKTYFTEIELPSEYVIWRLLDSPFYDKNKSVMLNYEEDMENKTYKLIVENKTAKEILKKYFTYF